MDEKEEIQQIIAEAGPPPVIEQISGNPSGAAEFKPEIVTGPVPKKRGPGRPRKYVEIPLEKLDARAAAALPAEIRDQLPNSPSPSASQTFLRVHREKIVIGVIGLLDNFGATFIEIMARQGFDRPEAKQFGDAARMDDASKALLQVGGEGICEKYSINFKWAEETCFAAGLGGWLKGFAQQVALLRNELASRANKAPDNR